MKKTLPIIIVLIGLSLLGLIMLQASWLKNLVQLREAQIITKINNTNYNIVTNISKELYSTTLRTPHRLQGLTLNNDMFNLIRPKSIGELFSLQEIQDKINKAFNNEDLKKIKYEFAVINSVGDYEMQTNGFTKTYFDSSDNKKFVAPIMPESGTEMEGLRDAQHLIIIIPNFSNQIWGSLFWIILGSALFTVIIIAAFFVTVRTLFNQKKLSEIKSDFINNMTHEFKTPLATISLAVDAIRNPKVINDPIKLQYFSNIIKDENKRMNKHVETILQAALLEKKELQFNNKKINANSIIATVMDNYQLQLDEKEATCKLELNAIDDAINADELHFTNVISNLIDNAIKYSKEELNITIKTFNKNSSIFISIEDDGIGMSKETTKNVFEKFYRAHTGNVHNVKGFGLGMSYVKTILDAIDSKIKVESTLGKGSIFTLEIPLMIS
jgi:two-component system phosphate regulon sensor histidine kinase PhoR